VSVQVVGLLEEDFFIVSMGLPSHSILTMYRDTFSSLSGVIDTANFHLDRSNGFRLAENRIPKQDSNV
jgi:hypothetical protein